MNIDLFSEREFCKGKTISVGFPSAGKAVDVFLPPAKPCRSDIPRQNPHDS